MVGHLLPASRDWLASTPRNDCPRRTSASSTGLRWTNVGNGHLEDADFVSYTTKTFPHTHKNICSRARALHYLSFQRGRVNHATVMKYVFTVFVSCPFRVKITRTRQRNYDFREPNIVRERSTSRPALNIHAIATYYNAIRNDFHLTRCVHTTSGQMTGFEDFISRLLEF